MACSFNNNLSNMASFEYQMGPKNLGGFCKRVQFLICSLLKAYQFEFYAYTA
jgi:hypothetical protein